MSSRETADERRVRLETMKQSLLEQIHQNDRKLERLRRAPKRPALKWESSDSECELSLEAPAASHDRLRAAADRLRTSLLASRELRGLQSLDVRVEELEGQPDVAELPSGVSAGTWSKYTVDGRIDPVPFKLEFHLYENKDQACVYRELTTTAVKRQHSLELQRGGISSCAAPGMAVECLSRYARAYAHRRSVLVELEKDFGDAIQCYAMDEGGFRCVVAGLLAVDWLLDVAPWRPCRHRFTFEILREELMDDDIYHFLKKAHNKLRQRDVTASLRQKILTRVMQVCAEQVGEDAWTAAGDVSGDPVNFRDEEAQEDENDQNVINKTDRNANIEECSKISKEENVGRVRKCVKERLSHRAERKRKR